MSEFHSVCKQDSSKSFEWILIKLCRVHPQVFKVNLMILLVKKSHNLETLSVTSVLCTANIKKRLIELKVKVMIIKLNRAIY